MPCGSRRVAWAISTPIARWSAGLSPAIPGVTEFQPNGCVGVNQYLDGHLGQLNNHERIVFLKEQQMQQQTPSTLDVIYESWRGYNEKLRNCIAALTNEQ